MADPVLAEAIGTKNGVNTVFDTPSAYYPGSVFVYWNGKLVQPADDQFGYVEQGDTQVSFNSAPLTTDEIYFYYQESGSSFGGFLPPPEMISAIDLKPRMVSAQDLVPRMISAEEV